MGRGTTVPVLSLAVALIAAGCAHARQSAAPASSSRAPSEGWSGAAPSSTAATPDLRSQPSRPAITRWVYQLQGYPNGRLDALARARAQVAVIDLARDAKSDFFRADETNALRRTGKVVLAYFEIGSIETFRPEYTQAGDLIVNRWSDWPDEYFVRYWDPRWWDRVVRPRVDQAIRAGFDGVYLDTPLAYEELDLSLVPGESRDSLARKMVALIARISSYAKRQRAAVWVVPQNSPELRKYPGYTEALARAGHTVYGVDAQPRVLESLSRGQPHIFEPGVEEVFGELTGSRIFVGPQLPHERLDAAVICVSTPTDPVSHRPNLTYLASAARDIARWCGPETLVVVRSTVPIGGSRAVVLPALLEAWGHALLVMAPERTIQGRALQELVDLPQVIGGLDEESVAAGVALFSELARQVVPVSTLETAEMVKLSNNCHTDLIYAFGNEIALIAEEHALDPLEVIRAANLDYPRPDLSKPGYVGGGCLSKDPYIMISSSRRREPFLVGRARELNEYLPVHVAHTVMELLH